MWRIPLRIFLALFALAALAHAQDPATVQMLTRAQTAFAGTTVVNDIQLTGTATRIAGSTQETGPITLLANSIGRARHTHTIGTAQRVEYASGHAESTDCAWTGIDGVQHPTAIHNCWTIGNWFLPALSYTAALTGTALNPLYVGRETQHGVTVEHLRFKRTVARQTPAMTSEIQTLSTTELFLDANTLLPRSATYFTHPDQDLRVNFPVVVNYSDYRNINGVQIPFRIQRSINGTLVTDVTVSSAAVNTGLPIQR